VADPLLSGPSYIAELAPAKMARQAGGNVQINIVVGILLAYLSNYLILACCTLGASQWRWQLGVAGEFLRLLVSHHVVRHTAQLTAGLVTKNKTDEALDVLNMMGSPGLRS